jgi:cysteine sulfinate desulfinase/cysteine desulfurase-like protein
MEADKQKGLRSGTLPVPLCVGMAAAADICASPDLKKNELGI